MKKSIVHILILLLSIGILASCNAPQSEEKVIKKKAQVYAEKYITAEARRCFDKPLSVKFIDVWFLDITERDNDRKEMVRHFDFVYKVEVDGNYKYYANRAAYRVHLGDFSSYYIESLDDFDFIVPLKEMSLNSFVKKIIEEGTSLDADAIYKYYIENYQ